MVRDTIASRKVKIKNPKTGLKLRFIMDKYSAEIFVNDGEQVLSTTFYTPKDAQDICFVCDKTATVSIKKYTISFD